MRVVRLRGWRVSLLGIWRKEGKVGGGVEGDAAWMGVAFLYMGVKRTLTGPRKLQMWKSALWNLVKIQAGCYTHVVGLPLYSLAYYSLDVSHLWVSI